MKTKLLLLLLCAAVSSYGQIANIPDGVFKSALLNATNNSMAVTLYSGEGEIIDINNDGQIQVSEAADVKGITGFHSIPNLTSIEGIKEFPNLISLNFDNANLLSLDLSGMTSLLAVQLGNVSGTANLSGCSNVVYLGWYDASIGNLDLSGMTGLTGSFSTLGPLTVHGSLNLSGCSGVTKVDMTMQYLTNINLNGCTALKEFILIGDPYLTSINFSGCPALEKIEISDVALTSIVLGTHLALTDVTFESHYLNNVSFAGCPNLRKLILGYNKMNTLDLSQCSLLNELYIDMDMNFQYLNLKNGDNTYTGFNVLIEGAAYICLDEGEEIYFTGSSANLQCQMNTYCSFTPGGSYNTITGQLVFDADNNGCGTGADVLNDNFKVKITTGSSTGYTYSSTTGNYQFYVQSGNHTLTPVFENNWFTATPAPATVNFANNNNNNSVQNFCITPNGSHPDVEVIVIPGTMQPGFDADCRIIIRNKGNQVLSGDVIFNFDDAVQDYLSATPVPAVVGTGTVTWNYTSLLPFEDRIINVVLNSNGPMETPPLNNGDVLTFTAAVTPVAGDETPADNSFTMNNTVVGSFDPNDITCLEGGFVHPDKIGQYLHYNINFENTGTAPATFIVVRQDINAADFDITSLQLLAASHAVDLRVTGNKVEYIFNNINLGAGQKGNLVYKIKSKNTLQAGDDVTAKANIYFDYNWPIATNDATTVFQVLSRGDFAADNSVSVYPNPSKGFVNIKADTEVESVQLYDVQGRLLEVSHSNGLDISGRAAGLFFLKIRTEKGVKVEKVVKE